MSNQLSNQEIIDKYNGDWYYISKYKYLQEEFIEKYQDEVDWYLISKYQNLSEEFIENYKDNINWYCFSTYKNFSFDFYKKYYNQLDVEDIKYNKKLSQEVKNKIIKYQQLLG